MILCQAPGEATDRFKNYRGDGGIRTRGRGFADPCLATWLRRLHQIHYMICRAIVSNSSAEGVEKVLCAADGVGRSEGLGSRVHLVMFPCFSAPNILRYKSTP